MTVVRRSQIIIKSSNYNENDEKYGGIGYIAEIINGEVDSIVDIIDGEYSLRDSLPADKKELIILRDFLSEVIENLKDPDPMEGIYKKNQELAEERERDQ